MTPELGGIHHLTAVTADVRENYRFYTQVMGLRLVKRTVNQDDTSAYHLFYADKVATPGTDLTFFDWSVPRESRGTHSIVRTALRVGSEASLQYWRERLAEHDVQAGEIAERDGRLVLDFEDREGQRLALVEDHDEVPSVAWEQSPVPPEHQSRGLGPIMISVPELEPTGDLLTSVMNMRAVRQYELPGTAHRVHVYAMGEGGPHAELHVAVQPDLPVVRPGAGGVHHVAFRTPSGEQYDEWYQRLARYRVPNSGKIDRYYFRSLYFREPNGILFEIATDGPGFGVDEDMATLGQDVVLPPLLMPQRERILARLKPIE